MSGAIWGGLSGRMCGGFRPTQLTEAACRPGSAPPERSEDAAYRGRSDTPPSEPQLCSPGRDSRAVFPVFSRTRRAGENDNFRPSRAVDRLGTTGDQLCTDGGRRANNKFSPQILGIRLNDSPPVMHTPPHPLRLARCDGCPQISQFLLLRWILPYKEIFCKKDCAQTPIRPTAEPGLPDGLTWPQPSRPRRWRSTVGFPEWT